MIAGVPVGPGKERMGGAPLGSRRRASVVGAIMLSAFSFNTTENLPIGLLKLMASDLRVSLSSVGYLVSGYGLTVAVVSLPLAHLTRNTPRRYLLSIVLVGSGRVGGPVCGFGPWVAVGSPHMVAD